VDFETGLTLTENGSIVCAFLNAGLTCLQMAYDLSTVATQTLMIEEILMPHPAAFVSRYQYMMLDISPPELF
jgi:hypothetical protein